MRALSAGFIVFMAIKGMISLGLIAGGIALLAR